MLDHRKIIKILASLVILLAVLFRAPMKAVTQAEKPANTNAISFTDVTQAAGLAGNMVSWTANWGDLNADGYPDLLTLAHDQAPPELFVNNKDGTFTNVIASTPLASILNRNGAAWGDFNNDGFPDLAIASGGVNFSGVHTSELYQNANGTLMPVANTAGVDDPYSRGRSVSWGDFNRDGYLDFFQANTIVPTQTVPSRLWLNNGDGIFRDVAAQAGIATNLALTAGSFIDYDMDGWPDIFIVTSNSILLYHNNRNGTFTDVAAQAGLAGITADSYAWGDYDGDGHPDLILGVNKPSSVDYFQSSGSEVKFTGTVRGDRTAQDGEDGYDIQVSGSSLTFQLELKGSGNCTSLSCIHIGEDGHSPASNPFTVGSEADGEPPYTAGVSQGYYLWHDSGDDTWHVRMSNSSSSQMPVFMYGGIITATSTISSVTPMNLEIDPPQPSLPVLMHNDGQGKFSNVTLNAGLTSPGNYHSINWVDYDNDGWLDLFLTDRGNIPNNNAPDHLYHNNGNGTFTDVASSVGLSGTPAGGGNVSSWADFNHDGFLDLFVQNGGWAGFWPFDSGPNQLFKNWGNGNHWLDIALQGTTSNRSGDGAVVSLTAGGRTQILENGDGFSSFNQSGNPLHFGLGGSSTIDLITIHWPDGIYQALQNVPADQYLTIVEQGRPPIRVLLPMISDNP